MPRNNKFKILSQDKAEILAKANADIIQQFPTPPASERKRMVVLQYDPKHRGSTFQRKIHDTIQYHRQVNSRLSRMVHNNTPPMEAMLVAINSFYRGKEKDGDYYHWMLDLYDGEMPDIVRRINKFRGFPQRDDPRWYPDTAEEWQERYLDAEYQAELERYLPYLHAYWNNHGINFQEHVALLDRYHGPRSKKDTNAILRGREDWMITGPLAERVCGLVSPPSLEGKSPWKEEMDNFRRDLTRSIEYRECSIIAQEAVVDPAEFYEAGIPNGPSPCYEPSSPPMPTRNGNMEAQHADDTIMPPSAFGHYTSPYQHPAVAQTPGLVWYHTIGRAPAATGEAQEVEYGEEYSAPVSDFQQRMQPLSELAPVFPRGPASASQYHSPAGDLISPNAAIANAPASFDDIKVRSDHQVLARANGFAPVPRSGIGPLPGRTYAPDAEQPFFPFGAFQPPRYVDSTPSPKGHCSDNRDLEERLATSPLDSARPSKRKRESQDSPDTPSTGRSAKRPNSGRRSTKRKSKKGKKNHDASDDDYEFEGLDHQEEDLKYEKLPPKRPSGTTSTRRPHNAKKSAALSSKPQPARFMTSSALAAQVENAQAQGQSSSQDEEYNTAPENNTNNAVSSSVDNVHSAAEGSKGSAFGNGTTDNAAKQDEHRL